MPQIITPEVLEHPSRKDARIVAMDFTTRAAEGDAPIIQYIGSDDSEDRYGSIVDPRGCDSSSYMRSGEGVFCFAHRYDIPTIGKCVRLEQKAKKLVFSIQFAVDEFDFAATIYRLVKGGYMSGSSIGFIPKEWEEYEAKTVSGYFAENRKYTKWELLELSAVPVPANRNALKLALADNVVSENEMRAFGLDQFIRGDLLYIMPRSLALVVDKDGKQIDTRAAETPAPVETPEPAPAAAPAAEEQKTATPEARRIGLRAAIKIASEGLRDCYVQCETTYTYCPLCWYSYVGGKPSCNCMEVVSPEVAAAEKKSIAALIGAASTTLGVALDAWDTAEHDALRSFASSSVWSAMWTVDRLLIFEDFWYDDDAETVNASFDAETVRKYVETVQKDAKLMARMKRAAEATVRDDAPETASRAGAVLSAKNRQRVENARSAAKVAHDHLDELIKEAFPEGSDPVTLDDEQKKAAAKAARKAKASGDTCPDCGQPWDDCTCESDDARTVAPKVEEIRCLDDEAMRTIVSGIRSLSSPAGEAGTTEGDIQGTSTAEGDGSSPEAADEKREGYSEHLRFIMNMK
jgi:hypothetical protein